MRKRIFQRTIFALFFCYGWIPGQVTAQETGSLAGLDVATVQEFDRLDRDRDGGLDELEFTFSEIAQRVRDTGAGPDKVKHVFERLDRDEELGIDLMEFAQSQHNRNSRLIDRASRRKYAGFDRDLDGLIGRKEYMDREGADAKVFGRIDLNDSSRVGPFEWVQGLRDEFMSKDDAPKFATLDADDNGAISMAEFLNGTPPAAFANAFVSIDLNGNQEVGPREFGKALDLPAGELGILPEDIAEFERLDRNRDRAISRREFSESRAGRRAPDIQIVDDRFAMIDRNDDRELSLVEFSRRFMRKGPRPGLPPKGPPPKGMGKGGKKGP